MQTEPTSISQMYGEFDDSDDLGAEDNDEEIGALGSILSWDEEDDAAVSAQVGATMSALEQAAAGAAPLPPYIQYQQEEQPKDTTTTTIPSQTVTTNPPAPVAQAQQELLAPQTFAPAAFASVLQPSPQQNFFQQQQKAVGTAPKPLAATAQQQQQLQAHFQLALQQQQAAQQQQQALQAQQQANSNARASDAAATTQPAPVPTFAVPPGFPFQFPVAMFAPAPAATSTTTTAPAPGDQKQQQPSAAPTAQQQYQQPLTLPPGLLNMPARTPNGQPVAAAAADPTQAYLGQMQPGLQFSVRPLAPQPPAGFAAGAAPVPQPILSAPLAVPTTTRARTTTTTTKRKKSSAATKKSVASASASNLVSCSDTDGEAAMKGSTSVSSLSKSSGSKSDGTLKSAVIHDSRQDMTPEEKAKANRDRNREHARNTRMRKKAYLEKLKSTVDELCRERDSLVSERAGAANMMVEIHNTRTEVLMSFFALRSTYEKKRDLWASILDESCFSCIMPVTPYRSFPASEVQVSKCQRTIMGIDGIMADTASLHQLLNTLVDRSRYPNASIQFRYTLVTEDAVVAGNQMMARWVMSTVNATQFGARMEVAKQGMLCCKFNSAHKIIGLELMFDVMAFMLQMKQAAGSELFSVVPNTVQTCQRTFDSPMCMTLAERPYTIVQVNKMWEEMTGFKAEDVVGKASCRVLQGQETNKEGVDALMSEIRYKRPASAMLVNYTREGKRFRNFVNVFPLSADSKITHYVALSIHFEKLEDSDPALPPAQAPAPMAATTVPKVLPPLKPPVAVTGGLTAAMTGPTAPVVPQVFFSSPQGLQVAAATGAAAGGPMAGALAFSQPLVAPTAVCGGSGQQPILSLPSAPLLSAATLAPTVQTTTTRKRSSAPDLLDGACKKNKGQ